MIPKKIQPYFKTMCQKESRENSIIDGALVCCDDSNFEVLVVGDIKYGLLSKISILPENDKILMKVRCKKCGKEFSVFDSDCDGYDRCENNHITHMPLKPIRCKKCREDYFSVSIRYEYPSVQELEELEIAQVGNTFTWIWVTLKCNKCGTVFKNFIDYETG